MAEEVCKFWRFGFCSRGDKCKFAHPPEEFGVDRDPTLPAEPTINEKRAGHRSGPYKKIAMENGGFSLTVFGLPWDATMREVTQIFRQYEGFLGCQMRGDYEGRGKVAYVQFEEQEQADFLLEILVGYTFDERDPSSKLRIIHSKKRGEEDENEGIVKHELYGA